MEVKKRYCWQNEKNEPPRGCKYSSLELEKCNVRVQDESDRADDSQRGVGTKYNFSRGREAPDMQVESPESGGIQSARCGRPRHQQAKYGPTVVLRVEKQGEGERVCAWASTSLIYAMKHRNRTNCVKYVWHNSYLKVPSQSTSHTHRSSGRYEALVWQITCFLFKITSV